MSTNWKNRGWSNMQSMLDEAMPVRKRPFVLFPVSGKVASLIIAAAALTGSLIYYNTNQNPSKQLSAFDFDQMVHSTSGLIADQISKDSQVYDNANSEQGTNHRPLREQVIQASSSQNATNRPSLPQLALNVSDNIIRIVQDKSSLIDSPINLTRESEKVDNLNLTVNQTAAQPSDAIRESEKLLASDQIETINEVIIETKTGDESPVEETHTPAIKKVKYTGNVTVKASVGNFTLNSPTLYGQLSLGYIHPLSQSFSIGMDMGIGKALLYQSREVRLSEYNSSSSGNVNAAEAPEKDLSAYMDVRSMSNVFAGIHSELKFSRNWSVCLGAQAAYLFHINHQALQSTSLIPEGQSPQQIFTPEEIADRFKHFNKWDYRFNAAINYHMTDRWSFELAYQQGFNSLLKYPIASNRNIQMQSITLGLEYKF